MGRHETSDLSFSISVADHWRALQTIDEHCRALKGIDEHSVALTSIADPCRAEQSIDEHLRALTRIAEHWQHRKALQSLAEQSRALTSIAEHWQALQSIDEHCRALQSIDEHCRALQSSAEYWQALQSIAEICHVHFNKAIQVYERPFWNKVVHKWILISTPGVLGVQGSGVKESRGVGGLNPWSKNLVTIVTYPSWIELSFVAICTFHFLSFSNLLLIYLL